MHYVDLKDVEKDIVKEAREWMLETDPKEYRSYYCGHGTFIDTDYPVDRFYFENTEEAMAFKLTWI